MVEVHGSLSRFVCTDQRCRKKLGGQCGQDVWEEILNDRVPKCDKCGAVAR